MYPNFNKLLLSILLASPPGLVVASCSQWVAKVESTQGKVHRQSPGHTDWQDIHREDTLCSGDKVRTLKWSRATLVLSNQAMVTLDQNSTLSLAAPANGNNQWLLKLLDGISFFRSRQPQQLQIETPFVNAVHEGTEFMVSVNAQQAEITVFDGQVAAQNPHGQVHIAKGYTGVASAKKAPRLQALTITPTDAVQWTLYYPPIIDETKSPDDKLNKALAAYQQGDIQQALAILEQIPANQQQQYNVTLAGLLLSVGRADEAQVLIKQIQAQEPNNSEAFALQAIIAVAKNQQQQALALAKQAVLANPNSAIAQIAQSYAYQALFNIDEALTATQAATRLSPNNALAWARLSELQLSQGDHNAALKSAQTAQTLNPKIARTQTILGFANLAQTNTSAAQQAFNQALTLDSSDPLARLGLGLAKIRTGDVEAGKAELETAVNLDPNNAITRSYLGKAYYELRNKDYAGTELKLAKEMDPKDPTPWFYDAILKQTTNRPVEALHDMQKAIELNDNRGVYRSSLLLDKDLAARSAAQGRIYNELGFQQLGLLEGWKSVNRDASNYSAHRLLADNYAALPRHEIARVSELLQSQLLQPVNITPIQPNLAESNTFILNSLGPTAMSYNEFNPLFEYNRFALQASGIYASNNTKGDNLLFSGIKDNTSFSLGQFHYETDGFRENNFFKQNLYNAFVQSKITDSLNLQAEYRHEDRDNGDLSLNFDLNNYNKNFNEKRSVDSYRIGGHYEFTPNSSLIGSILYQSIDIKQYEIEDNEQSILKMKQNGVISELQHNYTGFPNFNFINGFGHISQTEKQELIPDPPDKLEISKTNLYNYSKFTSNKIIATLGLSFDFLDLGSYFSKKPINPKFGIELKPFDSTSLRAAFFRSMSITRVANQTIEPTQVAGFNQFYDDINGTISWRFGAGIDHRFSENIAAGIEYSERKLDRPGESVQWKEQIGRSYLYISPLKWVSLGTEYFYERLDHPGQSISAANAIDGGLFDLVETHRVPITLGIFHSSGLIFKIKTSFVHQTGIFQNLNTESRYSDESDFFIVDLNINYRLPKRYGLISMGVTNLFNDNIKYQNTNNNETLFTPGRMLFSKISLSF